MRENNDMEILMQLKMNEFIIEPHPSDWQAIYEQLHPRKRRRFFWWWISLGAAISLFGAYWLLPNNQNNSTPENQLQPVTELQQPKIANKEQKPTSTPPNSDRASLHTPVMPGKDEPRTSAKSVTVAKSNNAGIPTDAVNRLSPTPDESTKQLEKTTESGSIPQVPEKTTESGSISSNLKQPFQLPSPPAERNELSGDTADLPGVSEVAAPPKAADELKSEAPVKEADKQVSNDPQAKKKSIPNLANHADKGWYLGAYAGLGMNNPTEPISMAKSQADVTSSPGSGSSYSTINSSDNSGIHLSIGLGIERKMKKMSISSGLGLQYNKWSSNRTIFKDSISPGNFFNRTLVANNTVSYSHLAMEIPIILNFKIAGKKQHTYWINAGLNNAITLDLNKKSDAANLPAGLSASLDNSPADPTTYQPQLRLGLMYENVQKGFHWQLSPFMQYGLSNLTRSGNPDVHLLQFGLQGRYYFKKLR